jgi:hypothetical protein
MVKWFFTAGVTDHAPRTPTTDDKTNKSANRAVAVALEGAMVMWLM